MKEFFKSIFKLFIISKVEASRILLLLPLLVILSLLFFYSESSSDVALPVVTSLPQGSYSGSQADGHNARRVNGGSVSSPSSADRYSGTSSKPYHNSSSDSHRSSGAVSRRDTLFFFDPNTIDSAHLTLLGFSAKQAAVIIRYRSAGAVFRQPADFKRCYTVSEPMFMRLEPYIRIATTAVSQATVAMKSTVAPKSATTTTPSVTNSATTNTTHSPFPQTPTFPIELNTADSATLTYIRGIGALTAGRIVAYRARLGGFVRVEQLAEVAGMTERNYLLILQQISLDSSKIKKIDINFATRNELSAHPYITARMLAKLVRNRELKGGWRTIRDVEKEKICSAVELEKLSPYLYFAPN